jgi:hypothetical protein
MPLGYSRTCRPFKWVVWKQHEGKGRRFNRNHAPSAEAPESATRGGMDYARAVPRNEARSRGCMHFHGT